MEFRGKVGKSIEDKTDKNGVPYCQFSAFSAEKVQDGFEYIWVSFSYSMANARHGCNQA